MSQTLRGEVVYLESKSQKSKRPPFKPYTLWSFKLKQDAGNLSDKLDAGFEAPAAQNGDYVEVVAELNDKGYLKVQSIAKVERPAHTSGAGQTASAEGEGVVDRQTQIVWQHSQDVAIAEVALLLANDALPLSKADNKAGQAKRYAELTAAISKKTVQRFFDVVTARLLETVADEGEVNVAADGEIPAASNSNATNKAEDGE